MFVVDGNFVEVERAPKDGRPGFRTRMIKNVTTRNSLFKFLQTRHGGYIMHVATWEEIVRVPGKPQTDPDGYVWTLFLVPAPENTEPCHNCGGL